MTDKYNLIAMMQKDRKNLDDYMQKQMTRALYGGNPLSEVVVTTKELPKKNIDLPEVTSVGQSKGTNRIFYGDITTDYSYKKLQELCSDPKRWNQGRKNNSDEFKRAESVTGVPADVIAYLYEVNTKNFPKQASAASKVKDGSKLSDVEVAKEVAQMFSKYDVQKGSFFALRKTPKEVRFDNKDHSAEQNLTPNSPLKPKETKLSFSAPWMNKSSLSR